MKIHQYFTKFIQSNITTREKSKEHKYNNINDKSIKEITAIYNYLRNTNKNNDFSRSKLMSII